MFQSPLLHYFKVCVVDVRRNQEGQCSLLGLWRSLCALGIVWECTHSSDRNKQHNYCIWHKQQALTPVG